jgi:hypothetical protein
VERDRAAADCAGSSENAALAQFSPERAAGFDREVAREDAQEAESTSEERIRARKPADLFMSIPSE